MLIANGPSTVRSITLRSDVEPHHKTTLWGLDNVLQDLAGENILEELNFFISVEGTDYDVCCLDSGDLFNLDSWLTKPGAFPKLRRVAINFDWINDEGKLDQGLTREHFVRLCNYPAVDFCYCENVYTLWEIYNGPRISDEG